MWMSCSIFLISAQRHRFRQRCRLSWLNGMRPGSKKILRQQTGSENNWMKWVSWFMIKRCKPERYRMMINFYFFPFTVMDERQAKTLSCFFDDFNVLDIHGGAVLPEPMASLAAKGTLARVYLDKEELALAEQKARAYLDWATIHKGNEKNLRALIRENVFFKDDSGVAAIRAGIRHRTVAHDPDTTTGRDVNKSLVFLKLADIHDREHQA